MRFVPISALPVAPPSQLLIHSLSPDPLTPSVSAFRNVLAASPSIQRRARLLAPQSHFSFVNPNPMPFPYNIPFSDADATADKSAFIEKWLSEREAHHQRPLPSDGIPRTLRIYDRQNVDQPRELIGIAETALRDCFPQLEVGDAFATLGAPSLSDEFNDEGDPVPSTSEQDVAARKELVDVLSGHSSLMTPPETEDRAAFAPWSLRYSGHQFGSWAGQLGDGRATSILVSPHPSNPDLTYEIQLKGSGRTPFARMADGLAVLRSSIREYLCSEAMHALGIPTTRSLTLISLPALPVARERIEHAAVVSRVAPSFIRIGSFEALNGPTSMYFFGGGQQDPDLDALRVLGEWVAKAVLKLELDWEEREAWGKKLVVEVARRNARMVAAWQVYGFMHGVINTDNVSVLGLTIDYGPYSFMDVFDPLHICNHTDEGGRYAYKYQPNMILYALRALLDSLAPLIGAESSLDGKAVSPGWTDGVPKEKIEEWRKEGLKFRDEVDRVFQEETSVEYARLMRKRLALRHADSTDEPKIFRPLLGIMGDYKLDFHSTFRTLSTFRPSMILPLQHEHETAANGVPAEKGKATERAGGGKEIENEGLHELIAKLLSVTPEPARLDHAAATRDWLGWLEVFARRVESERGEWEAGGKEKKSSRVEGVVVDGVDVDVDKGVDVDLDVDKERKKSARGANPRFVLRQWVLEEVIKRVERDGESGRRVLAKVMHMACNPFEPWGAEDKDKDKEGRADEELDDKEAREERRYCGLGEANMLGFQCSCSS